MDKVRDVAVIVGSLRKDSINLHVANALAQLSLPSLRLNIIEIGHLPIYNQDGDESPPLVWTKFRERIKAADAVLFVTPEHNRSVPAVLKNALDIGSRPYGDNAWNGKPGAVISASPGGIGGFGANHHLRQSLVFLIAGSGNLVHNLHTYAWGQHMPEPYDWAVKFEEEAKQLMLSGDFKSLVNYEKLGPAAILSVPTPDHYLPLLYVIATRQQGENITFPVEGVDGGSISMLSVSVGERLRR